MSFALEPLPETATPKDYLRLQFDPANVPSKRIVGLLACQRDPLLRLLSTRIISAKPAPISAVPAQKGKGLKKKEKSSPSTSGTATPVVEAQPEVAAGRLWEVELEDTVIFPEGGGQPSDMGYLHFSDPNGGTRSFRVEMCIRKKLESIHLVRVSAEDEAYLETVGKAVAEGEKVTIEVETDWERRVDQMTLHTAQHLLSAVLDTRSLPTLSWAMHAHPSLEPPYVELSRQLTWKEAEEVEVECNRLIGEAKRIWIEVSVQGDENGVDGDAERESRGLPKDYAGGVIRHCCIDQTDRNACCGTQVPNLSLCSFLHVIPPSLAPESTTPSKSATKLFFTSGPRAARYLSSCSRELSSVAQAVQANRSNAAERAARSEELRKDAGAINGDLRRELVRLLVETAGQDNVTWVHRDQRGTHDFEFLGLVAGGLMALEGSEGRVAVLTSAVDGTPGGLLLVQSKDDKLAKEIKDKLAAAIDDLGGEGDKGKRVRGGGAKGRYMSKIEGKFGKRERVAVARVIDSLKQEA